MAAANTYVSIATQTLGSAAASVTFSSIPSTYTDLVLVVNGAIASGAQDIWVQVNGDTGANYSRTNLWGGGTTVGSTRLSAQTKFAMNDAAALDGGYQFNAIMQFMNYSNTTTYKTMLERANNAARGVDAGVHLWRSTAAINSIYVYNSGATNYVVGSTFSLYGIAAA
jgi:hypothetical protein